jgi:hypothetical protein
MKARKVLFPAIVIFLAVLMSACGGSQPAQQTSTGKLVPWEYQPAISTPIKAVSDKQAITLQDSNNVISVKVPGGSFDTATSLSLGHPQNVPQVMSSEFTPIGAPIEISGADTRLNQPATVTFRVDKDRYASELKDGSLCIAYYDGRQWEYFEPTQIEPSSGMLSFTTYHFSLFGYGKISVEQQIKQYSHSKVVAKTVQKNVDKVVDKIVEQTVEHILKDKLGMNEDSTKFKIMSSLANDDEYRDLVDQFREGNAEEFNKTMMVFAGKKIAENVGKSALQSSLKYLSGKGVGMLEAGSQAAGFVAEGQYAEAGKIIGEKIADGFLVTKFVKAGAEIVQYNINTWKDAEIEAAYKAYQNGSNNKFFGYNVDLGDFDAVWNQMRGIGTRLESEAVNREIKRRENLGLRPPTDAELDAVRAQVKTDLKDQFEKRKSQEAEMEKETARTETLIGKLKDNGLLEEGMYGYDEANFNTETRLDQLLYLSEKILRDTGRKDWNTTLFSNDKEICANDMIALMKAWYSKNGPAEYAKLLYDKFKIGGPPSVASSSTTTAATAQPKTGPRVTGITGPDKFEFDSGNSVTGQYSFSVSVEGGTPPYTYTWIGRSAPQALLQGEKYASVKISPQDMRQPGAIKDGFFIWVTVKDSKGQHATWGIGNTQFTYGLKFTGRFETVNGVTTLVENKWEKVTEP